MRDLASFPEFPQVKRMVENERVTRNIRRHYPRIVELVGEECLKKPYLNKRAYVCYDNEGVVDRYIEGVSQLSSPSLSTPSSANVSPLKK